MAGAPTSSPRENKGPGHTENSCDQGCRRICGKSWGKEGKGKKANISSQQIISEGLCEVCKVLRLDERLSNYLQLHKGQGKGHNIL